MEEEESRVDGELWGPRQLTVGLHGASSPGPVSTIDKTFSSNNKDDPQVLSPDKNTVYVPGFNATSAVRFCSYPSVLLQLKLVIYRGIDH